MDVINNIIVPLLINYYSFHYYTPSKIKTGAMTKVVPQIPNTIHLLDTGIENVL